MWGGAKVNVRVRPIAGSATAQSDAVERLQLEHGACNDARALDPDPVPDRLDGPVISTNRYVSIVMTAAPIAVVSGLMLNAHL